eukprot:10458284-Alexandrium_andersonii.AAC.1
MGWWMCSSPSDARGAGAFGGKGMVAFRVTLRLRGSAGPLREGGVSRTSMGAVAFGTPVASLKALMWVLDAAALAAAVLAASVMPWPSSLMVASLVAGAVAGVIGVGYT